MAYIFNTEWTPLNLQQQQQQPSYSFVHWLKWFHPEYAAMAFWVRSNNRRIILKIAVQVSKNEREGERERDGES